ncbi:unnamed protein product [Ambrosiozyma monospora]|uniref:Unnamed protein product n=1 Tax=Ambrosiozyma monospora TaxID=43982 RepID=A0A9W7DMY9_AMBMO|nr:unnamed protein product [Ambrosiozyma monospora]
MFWGHALEHAVFLHNLTPKKGGLSPIEILNCTPRKVDASKLILFGSRVNSFEIQMKFRRSTSLLVLTFFLVMAKLSKSSNMTRRVGRTADFKFDNLIVFPLVKVVIPTCWIRVLMIRERSLPQFLMEVVLVSEESQFQLHNHMSHMHAFIEDIPDVDALSSVETMDIDEAVSKTKGSHSSILPNQKLSLNRQIAQAQQIIY